MDIREHERELISANSVLDFQGSIAFTGIIDGRIVCCGGVLPYHNGNAEIWLVPSIWIKQYAAMFAKELYKWLMRIRRDLALTRMQTFCQIDELHDRWMTFLGFTCEGVVRKYHNGNDYKIWGRVWE